MSGDADEQKMLKIVCALLARPESEPFRAPVAWKVLGLDDYPKLVKKPMDLGTVKERLQKGEYENAHQVASDVRLVWTNCIAYNQDGSEFYHLADTFARKFEEAYATLHKGSEAGERDPERVPTIDERMRLSYDLFKLNDADLGRTLTMIEGDGDGGPSVLSKTRGTDEVMINVDLLRPRLFHDVQAFVESCFENASGNKKRKLKE